MRKKVSVVMATFYPNLTFLAQQLDSLNKQTYPEIELIICDDSANNEQFTLIENAARDNIINFKYFILKNNKNIGSNKTFERLTELATGDYIAYCDQDDIWEPQKVLKLVNKIEKENAIICYSDLAIINESGQLINRSFKSIAKRVKHIYGNEKYSYFIKRNSITGCTMLMDTKIAKKSIPFPENNEYVHDHWLALFGSFKGRISYVEEPLVLYRIHSNNQIGATVLNGIESKNDYIQKKLEKDQKRIIFLENHIKNQEKKIIESIHRYQMFVEKRECFFEKKTMKNILSFLGQFKEDPQLIVFEFLINMSPDPLVKTYIKKIKV
ncbi:glycosyltransferase family 2 protein [Bacillus sp. V5-8f]|uniref:glycosyltransferase family 2 protein n=1 Tax=Bacillus sp. V5-8f TaxID=2053044 RepID=UPI000C78E9A8|nr:glycosyltransferase family 2 protein [Bacillus sp. V5-8f]PLT35758.1 glycosyltransferase family 2 protein [Bacillus sp. V5-8f]